MSDDWIKDEKVRARLKAKLDREARLAGVDRFSARRIYNELRRQVIGQDIIAARIAKTIERRSFLEQASKPLARMLIAGPTSTGKTQLAKSLASAVYGDGKKYLEHIDCGNLGTDESSLAQIRGSDGVYQGAGRGRLNEFLRTKRKGVILFDEIEKAAPTPTAPLAKLLLALLDEGRVRNDYDNRDEDATKCIIVLTSNAKQDELGKLASRTLSHLDDDYDPYEGDAEILERMDEEARLILADSFAPEFFARLDFVSTVTPLGNLAKAELVDLLLRRVVTTYGMTLTDRGPGFEDFLICGVQQLKEGNARDLERWLEKIAVDAIIEAKRKGLVEIVLDWVDDTMCVAEKSNY